MHLNSVTKGSQNDEGELRKLKKKKKKKKKEKKKERRRRRNQA
jgi:hypothetical protein